MKKLVILFALGLGFSMQSCETDDVVDPNAGAGPEVTIVVDPIAIVENGGVAEVTASLSESSESEVTINLSFNGSATEGTDYTTSSNQIIIPAGSITGSLSITAIDNDDEDGSKTVLISIESIENGYESSAQELQLTIEDDDGAIAFNVIFNEILYDPPSGIDGDANGDGVRDALDDEFMEMVNLSALPMDISGFEVYDAKALTDGVPRHVFPQGTVIDPGKALVLFGGGTPTGSFGGAIVQTASGGELNMTNAGDLMQIYNTSNELVMEFDIEPLSDNPDESYTRDPDLTGDFVQHASTSAGTLFSPGTYINGNPF